MDQDQEDELLLHVAAGTDPAAAMAATDDDDDQRPTGGCGYLVMLLAVTGLTFSVCATAWQHQAAQPTQLVRKAGNEVKLSMPTFHPALEEAAPLGIARNLGETVP